MISKRQQMKNFATNHPGSSFGQQHARESAHRDHELCAIGEGKALRRALKALDHAIETTQVPDTGSL